MKDDLPSLPRAHKCPRGFLGSALGLLPGARSAPGAPSAGPRLPRGPPSFSDEVTVCSTMGLPRAHR
eukprot:1468203-Pyramimonas_sp.AAC.1